MQFFGQGVERQGLMQQAVGIARQRCSNTLTRSIGPVAVDTLQMPRHLTFSAQIFNNIYLH